MLKNLLLVTGYLLLVTTAVVPFPAEAQGLVPCQLGNPNAPGAIDRRPQCTIQYLILVIVRIYNLLLGLAAIIAVMILIFSGIRMLIYQYEEKPEKELEDAKWAIKRAIAGIVIIICAYLIVYTLLVVLGVQSGPLGNDQNPTLRSFLRQFGFNI